MNHTAGVDEFDLEDEYGDTDVYERQAEAEAMAASLTNHASENINYRVEPFDIEKRDVFTIKYAVLENGHHVDAGTFNVGDMYPTQWGPREVLSVYWERIEQQPDPVLGHTWTSTRIA